MDALDRNFLSSPFFIFGSALILMLVLYISPIAMMLAAVTYVFIVRGRPLNNVFSLLVAVFFATVASIVNPNGEVIGDVVRYYNLYDYGGGFYTSLLEMKLYQYLLFNIMEFLELPNRFYSFTSIFIFSFNVISVSLTLTHKLGIPVLGAKRNLIFIFILFGFIPSSIHLSFEYLLALSFILRSLSSILSKKYIYFALWCTVGILVHNGVVYFAAMILFAHIIRNRKYSIIFLFSSLIPLVLFMLSNQIHTTGIDYLDIIFKKLFFYINGPWSRYETLGDYDYFLYTILRLLSCFIVLYLLIEDRFFYKEYVTFILVFSVSSLFFPPSRTLFFRYVYFGVIFLIPAYAYIMLKMKAKQSVKYFLFIFVLISGFQYMNFSVYRLIFNHVETLVLFGRMDKIVSYKLNVPVDNFGSERE